MMQLQFSCAVCVCVFVRMHMCVHMHGTLCAIAPLYESLFLYHVGPGFILLSAEPFHCLPPTPRLCVCMCVCCVCCVCVVCISGFFYGYELLMSEANVRSLGTRVAGGYEPSYGCWESTRVQEEQVLFPDELALQPRLVFGSRSYYISPTNLKIIIPLTQHTKC